jgi:hypothetical protein
VDVIPSTAVWTGRAVVVVAMSNFIVMIPGGSTNLPGDGAAFDPRSNRWYRLARPPVVLADDSAPLVWTGHDVLTPGNATGSLRLGP